MDDSKRLNFVLNHSLEWQDFKLKDGSLSSEMEVWKNGRCEIFVANTKSECVDMAIEKLEREAKT